MRKGVCACEEEEGGEGGGGVRGGRWVICVRMQRLGQTERTIGRWGGGDGGERGGCGEGAEGCSALLLRAALFCAAVCAALLPALVALGCVVLLLAPHPGRCTTRQRSGESGANRGLRCV